MSEGQLKKRMLQGMHDFSLHDPENLTNEMFEFIDEAKKDFFELVVKDCITDEIIISDEDEMIKRLKKWFGDST